MNIYSRTNKGFTLIELLVVIAIIGILSSVVLASLNSARVKARDARRMADLHSLELAIMLYYDATGGFPNNDSTGAGDWSAAYKAQLAPYISKPPLDPLANDGGRYYASSEMTWSTDPNCNGQYVLWAYIEGANPNGIYCGWGSNHYFRLLGPY